MPLSDYRELTPAYRHLRIRRIEALKAIIRSHNYEVGAQEIAEGIIEDARRTPRYTARH